MLFALVAAAHAHGAGFSAVGVSVDRADPDELWVVTDVWGLAHTTDGGATWEWLCEESVGGSSLYAVLSRGPGAAVVGARNGLLQVGGDCTSVVVPGVPEGAFVPGLAAYGDGYLAFVVGIDADGVYLCDTDGCAPTELVGDGLFPKSALADGSRAWATVVYEDDLASELWRSDDGSTWDRVHSWPDGDTDPRVLYADGDHLLVWRRTRSEDDTPQLLESHDGGVTFTAVFETGSFTDTPPALLVLPDTLLLGSFQGARTWRSDDRGSTWTEVSTEVPSVRCADVLDGTGWACGEHLQDGFDLSRTTDGRTWVPVACLETALPAACAGGTCDPLLDAYQTAGSYGGGHCDAIITPPEEAADDPAPCGCAGGSQGLVVLGLFAWGRRKRRG